MSATEQLMPVEAVGAPAGGFAKGFGTVRQLGLGGMLGVGGLLLLVVTSAYGRFLTDTPGTDVDAILEAPSLGHPLGTDFTGRDNLLLVVRGGWDMLELALVAGVLMSVIAVAVGMLGALSGGVVDRVTTRITDLWLTIPRLVLLLVIASLFPFNSTFALAVLIAVFGWPALARQVHAQALSLRNREHVEAARLLQLRTSHILLRYLLPAIGPFVMIQTITGMTVAIYQQVVLAFFGLVPLEDNWSVLFSVAYGQNAIYLPAAAWSMFAPVAAVCFLQFCLVLTSRSLEGLFDPRLRSTR